ncbi:MAG: hypothetical protein HOP12_09750 [Candidatus Eisenbacteria bacterium]|uniref:Uncharacterized protein n=1 Tax=Eiseniibacteriota bacterium TaxID=2212470 RepID=A0A849SST3_UNCEI|nr:hypothetical protein [Candidatus Eisenbacteria bacterium]
MKPDLLEKIKSRGYWRIHFQPLVHAEKLTTIDRCREIVEQSALELRGWEYPAILNGASDVGRERTQQYFELSNDWENHIEFWRMYKTGQFLHYLALREDWLADDQLASMRERGIAPMARLGVVGSVYTATEIYAFLARLTRAGLYDEGVSVGVTLYGTKDRALLIDDPGRVGFSYERKTSAEKLEWNRVHSKEEVLQQSTELSRDLIREWFDVFGWQAAPELIAKDQERLLTRRL